MFTFIEPKSVQEHSVELYFDGSVAVADYCINHKDIRGRYAVFKQMSDDSLSNALYYSVRYSEVEPGDYKNVFVSSSSKISRDCLRRSYNITRDPDKADCVTVVPYKQNFRTLKFNLACYDTRNDINVLHLYNFTKKFTTNEDDDIYEDALIETIKNKILYGELCCFDNVASIQFFNTPDCHKDIVTFCFKCPEYIDIVNDVHPEREYVFDNNIHYEPTPIISIDTLDMWKDMPDDMFYKSIQSSNWQDYPLTLSLYICSEKRNLLRNISPQFTYIHGCLGLGVMCPDGYRNGFTQWLGKRTITAEDWNMCQELALNRMGLAKEGGFTSNTPTGWYNKVLNIRNAVKPTYLSGSVSGTTLENLINND